MKYIRLLRNFLSLIYVTISLISYSVYAQETITPSEIEDTGQVVNYDAEFFSRYRPSTALDMVNQLPGFQLDDGDGSSG